MILVPVAAVRSTKSAAADRVQKQNKTSKVLWVTFLERKVTPKRRAKKEDRYHSNYETFEGPTYYEFGMGG